MEKKVGKIERRLKSGHFGSFLFGFLVGIITLVATVGGIGAYAYFNLSANWLNNTFNTNVNLGSESANNLTISALVNEAIYLSENKDTYTLADLEENLGVELPEKLIGIKINDLKAVAIDDLADAVKTKFANISAEELSEILTLTDLEDVLDKTNTYYLSEEVLYKNKEYDEGLQKDVYSNPVDKETEFDYTVESTTSIKIKDFQSFNVNAGKVEIALRYLPLTYALSSFTSNLGDTLTIGELTDPDGIYKVTLPDYIVDGNEDKTINEITTIIDDMQIAKILGYTINAQNPSNPIVLDGGRVVNGVMAKIALWKVSELSSTKFNELTVEDIFGADADSGVLSLISKTTTLDKIADELSTTMTNLTLEQVVTKEIIALDTDTKTYYNNNKEKIVAGTGTELKNLLLSDLIQISITSVPLEG